MDVLEGVNEDLLRAAVAHIEEDPSTWHQREWVHYNCKTSFCLAGWAVALSGLVNEETGAPTEKGWDFAAEHGLWRPYVNQGQDGDGNWREEWEFPYGEAARILLRLPRSHANRIFDQYAAKPLTDEGCGTPGCGCRNEERQEWVPDSVEELKKTITRHTGVAFEEADD